MSKKPFETAVGVKKRKDGKFEVAYIDRDSGRVINMGRESRTEEEARKHIEEMKRPLEQRGDNVRVVDLQ